MDKWEYYAAYIAWDEASSAWLTSTADDKPVVGRLSEVLSEVGAQGWELVSVCAEYWFAAASLDNTVKVYRAFFKRHREPPPVTAN